MMSNGDAGTKRMHVGAARAQYRDVTSHLDGVVVTDDTGAGEFGCTARQVSVRIPAAMLEIQYSRRPRRRVAVCGEHRVELHDHAAGCAAHHEPVEIRRAAPAGMAAGRRVARLAPRAVEALLARSSNQRPSGARRDTLGAKAGRAEAASAPIPEAVHREELECHSRRPSRRAPISYGTAAPD